MPIDRWIGKHTRKYYSNFKKTEILQYTVAWMNLEDLMLGEISQKHKIKTILHDFTYL